MLVLLIILDSIKSIESIKPVESIKPDESIKQAYLGEQTLIWVSFLGVFRRIINSFPN